MLITGIKSRPIYDTLSPIARAKRHIVVAQGSGGIAARRLLDEMSRELKNVTVVYSTESFSGRNLADDLRGVTEAKIEIVGSNIAAVARLRELLSGAVIGTVLYLSGSETFIGTAMHVATEFNLKSDEVLREHCGTLARRVLCMHCGAINENITRRLFKCSGCGETLIVRDHYSRNFAAFMGVKADAETPGILPPDEELDT